MPEKTNLCLAAAAATAVLLAAACGGNTSPRTSGTAGAGSAGQAKAAAPSTPHTAPAPSPSRTADPGMLPQTRAMPGDQDVLFTAGARSLWQAIVQDKPEIAHPFFFPRSAYEQVKAISDPDEDYRDRLISWYDLDIRAAHGHLGSNAAKAEFVGVDVPKGDAEWIEPGAEYNKGSYYRVYGARLNYRVDGHAASIGVFSLISWRGEWYVVHLGPSTRPSAEGIVYDARD